MTEVVSHSEPFRPSRRVEELIAAQSWSEAAQAAAEVADQSVDDPKLQRQASGCLSQFGDFAQAAPYAARAVALDAGNAEYAQHYGAVLNACGDYVSAVRELTKAARGAPREAETFQQLAFAAAQLGNAAFAAELSVFASRLEPKNESRKLTAAHYLTKASRLEDAVEALRANQVANSPTASVLRTLSGLLGQLARFDEALRDIDDAIRLQPDTAEFHLHRSWLLAQMQRWDDALTSAFRAMELEPESRQARRHTVTVLVESGDIEEAVRHGGALLAMAPGEPEYLSCMAFLLDANSMRSVARDFEDIAALKRNAPPRELRANPRFAEKLRTQKRSISALVLRDIRSRYGDSRLGFFWTLMEPLIHVGFLALVFEFTMHGNPPLGTNFFFFYFTGVMPYLLLSHLVNDLGHVVKGNKNLLQVANVTPFDLMIAKSIVDSFTSILIYFLFTAMFFLAGIDATPVSMPLVAEAFVIALLIGMGAGMLCSVIFEFGPFGESIVNILLRVLYFASGIFYVPANMPVFARSILAYNPFLHIIDTMRMGYFANYDPPWNDPGYAAIFSIVTLALGMLAVKTMSRRMRSIH